MREKERDRLTFLLKKMDRMTQFLYQVLTKNGSLHLGIWRMVMVPVFEFHKLVYMNLGKSKVVMDK